MGAKYVQILYLETASCLRQLTPHINTVTFRAIFISKPKICYILQFLMKYYEYSCAGPDPLCVARL
jgi:hypothetical protein